MALGVGSWSLGISRVRFPVTWRAMATTARVTPAIRTPLNANQIKGFWAAWGGWCLDGMDAFIYSLVLVPALQELLPKSGLAATPGNIGFYYGWRWMFVLGGTPALLVGWIQSGVHESAAWKAKFDNPAARPRMRDSFAALFTPRFSRQTVTLSLLFTVSIIGLWAGSIYVPTAVTQIAQREGRTMAEAARLASYAGAVLAIGTIIGCLLAPAIAER